MAIAEAHREHGYTMKNITDRFGVHYPPSVAALGNTSEQKLAIPSAGLQDPSLICVLA